MFMGHRQDPTRIQHLEYEIKRLLDAQLMMQEANRAVSLGDRHALFSMGFEPDHIDELIAKSGDGKQAFGDHSLRNNQQNIEHLQKLLATEKSRKP